MRRRPRWRGGHRSRKGSPAPETGVRRPRLALPDLVNESLAGVAARPARLLLTILGTVLGTAALLTTIGLAQTASGQVGGQFDAVAAQQVVVEPRSTNADDGDRPTAVIPWDAPERAERLNGVLAAGTFSQLEAAEGNVRAVGLVDPRSLGEPVVRLVASSPGLLDAVQGHVVLGRYFDAGHDQRGDRVAVLGVNAAEKLHINRVDDQPAIFIGDDAFVVIGIIDGVVRRTELLDAVIVPNGAAQARLRLVKPGELHVHTQLGAAGQVGHELPMALDASQPEAFRARVPPSLGDLRARVQSDVNALFLALGGVALLAGAVGIANVTLLSVLERVGEIGLRRALGATRRHVAIQFLFESTTVGLLGGLVGAAVGVLATVGVAVVRGWTPLMDPLLAAVVPLLGAAVGLVAGVYPAWKSSAIEPIAALRRDA